MIRSLVIWIGCLLFLNSHQAMGGDVPDWVQSRMDVNVKPLSKESAAQLVYSNIAISRQDHTLLVHTQELFHLTRSQGLRYGTLAILMTKDDKANRIKGWRFSSEGQLLEKLKRENIKKRAYNLSFYDDSEQVIASFEHVSMGDWVAFEYTQKINCFFDDFTLPMGEAIDVAIRRVQIGNGIQVTLYNDGKKNVQKNGVTFELTNWVAPVDEPLAPHYFNSVPMLGLVWEKEFHASWEAFGRHYWGLTKHLGQFQAPIDSEIMALLKNADPKERIMAPARMIQEGINYVDIEFGKGGIIPRSCDFVHEKKYGDCKDMAFYAVAIYREMGLEAFPVLVKSSTHGLVDPSFIGDQFNHVIAAVKLPEEVEALANLTLDGSPWMLIDLTDPYTPLPLFPRGLEHTYGLLIHPQKSQLFQLPLVPAEKNHMDVELTLHLDAEQTLNVTWKETRRGHFFARKNYLFKQVESSGHHELIADELARRVPGCHLDSFEVQHEKDYITATYKFQVKFYGIQSPDGLLVIPNLFDFKSSLFKRRKRALPMVLKPLSSHRLSIDFSWDPTWRNVRIPSPGEIDSNYFSGQFKVNEASNRVQLLKDWAWKRPLLLPEEYAGVRAQYRKFRKVFNSPVVLKPSQ